MAEARIHTGIRPINMAFVRETAKGTSSLLTILGNMVFDPLKRI
jgi:hypothetical protein